MFYIILLIALLILLLFLKIQIELKIIIKNGSNFSFVIIRFLGFIRLRMNLSFQVNKRGFISLTLRKTDSNMDTKASFDQFWDATKDFLQLYEAHVEPFRYFKRKVKFNNFSVCSRIGTGDAASTAMTIGGCYALFTIISQYLYRHFQLKKSKLDMLPYFSGPLFDLDLDCIMNFKFGHIIIAGLKLLTKKEKAVS